MISSEKLMVTIEWNSDGFRAIEVLPKGQKCNADYQCSSVLTKLSKIARHMRNQTRRKLILHGDNALPHIAKSRIELCPKLDFRVALHPPHSPNLALSDYFLFGYLKDKLKGLLCPPPLHFHRAIKQTVQSIDRLTLMASFDPWIVRAELRIQLDGDYVE
jgi:hypothetical protein